MILPQRYYKICQDINSINDRWWVRIQAPLLENIKILRRKCHAGHSIYFFKWAIPGLFFFIFVSSTQLTVNKCAIKVCRCLDSNRGSLASEATALPLSHNHCPIQYFLPMRALQVSVIFVVDSATQLGIPNPIPWIGQGGGMLLLHYSMICVIGLPIFDYKLEGWEEITSLVTHIHRYPWHFLHRIQ